MRIWVAFLAGLALAACAAPTTTVIPPADLPEDVYGSPDPPASRSLPDSGTVFLVLEGQLTPTARELPDAGSLPEALVKALFLGPTGAYKTAIPDGTRTIDVRIEDGVATVNVTEEFERSAQGARLALRVAQVVYTITEAPGVFAVVFEVEGSRAAVLTDSEQVVERPVTRADYERFDPKRAGTDGD